MCRQNITIVSKIGVTSKLSSHGGFMKLFNSKQMICFTWVFDEYKMARFCEQVIIGKKSYSVNNLQNLPQQLIFLDHSTFYYVLDTTEWLTSFENQKLFYRMPCKNYLSCLAYLVQSWYNNFPKIIYNIASHASIYISSTTSPTNIIRYKSCWFIVLPINYLYILI